MKTTYAIYLIVIIVLLLSINSFGYEGTVEVPRLAQDAFFNPDVKEEDPAKEFSQTERSVKLIDMSHINTVSQDDTEYDLLKLIENLEKLDIPANTAQPQEQPSETEPDQQQMEDYKKTQKETIQQAIDKLLENYKDVENPLLIADALYKKENTDQAAIFYQLALKKTLTDDEDPDRAWILFQAANCLRFNKPERAYELYQKLIDEYPNSYWIKAAQTRQEIIMWSTHKNTIKMMEQYIGE